MSIKEHIAVVNHVSFAVGVLHGIEGQHAHPNAEAGVKEAKQRLQRALKEMEQSQIIRISELQAKPGGMTAL